MNAKIRFTMQLFDDFITAINELDILIRNAYKPDIKYRTFKDLTHLISKHLHSGTSLFRPLTVLKTVSLKGLVLFLEGEFY